MENKAHAIAAGIFTVLLTVALVGAAFWIRGEPIGRDAYVLYTRGKVTGLNVQAPVRYRGVAVGKVESIAFDPEDVRTILIGITVKSGTPLTLGTYGELAAQGITGLSYVQLGDDGTHAELRRPADPEQARIELRPSFMERMSDTGEQVMMRVAALADRLDTWLADDNRRQTLKTLAALEEAAHGVATVSDSVQASLKGVPELAQQAGGTLRRVDALMGDLRTLAGTLGARAQVLDRVGASADRISTAVEQLGAAGTRLSASMATETMPRLNRLLEELSRNSRGLSRLIDDLNANPASLVFGKPTPASGPGEPGFVHGAER